MLVLSVPGPASQGSAALPTSLLLIDRKPGCRPQLSAQWHGWLSRRAAGTQEESLRSSRITTGYDETWPQWTGRGKGLRTNAIKTQGSLLQLCFVPNIVVDGLQNETSMWKKTLFTAARQRIRNFRSCDALHEALNKEVLDIFKFPGSEWYNWWPAETCSASVPQSCKWGTQSCSENLRK